jgi:HTH-type transcriptional regulator, sugar sensing transcriptional regulator
MDPATALVSLGLSEYEARAYVALARHGPLNGYEVAKHSGVPRANVYAALERLERRRIVVAVLEGDATRYSARPQAEFIKRLRREHELAFDRATAALAVLKPAQSDATVINIRGYETAIKHAGDAIAAGKDHLLLAVHPPEARALAEVVENADERGVDITTLCMSACETECGACRGRLYRYRVTDLEAAHWLLVVADATRVVATEIQGSEATAVETSQKLIAELAGAYIRNAIALATVVEDLGDSLESRLKPTTRRVLSTLGPAAGTGFLDSLKELLQESPGATASALAGSRVTGTRRGPKPRS